MILIGSDVLKYGGESCRANPIDDRVEYVLSTAFIVKPFKLSPSRVASVFEQSRHQATSDGELKGQYRAILLVGYSLVGALALNERWNSGRTV